MVDYCLFKSNSEVTHALANIFGRDGSTHVEYNIYMKITFVKGRASYASVNNLRTVEAMKKSKGI